MIEQFDPMFSPTTLMIESLYYLDCRTSVFRKTIDIAFCNRGRNDRILTTYKVPLGHLL